MYIKCCLYLEILAADCVVTFPIPAMCSGLLVLSLVTQSHLITVRGEQGWVIISRGLCGLLEGTVQSCGHI